jgi:hypothetical protein
MSEKNQFLELINSNIEKHKFHLTTVNSLIEPRYVYSIGLKELFGFELIFAGAIYYLKEDVSQIFEEIVEHLRKGENMAIKKIKVGNIGNFSFSNVDESWSKLMMLGVFDYYKIEEINAFQIIPDSFHFTFDTPDMSKKFNISSEPVWQWLVKEWDYNVPSNSSVATNVAALLGKPITEIVRCEINEWEMFAGAGPDVEIKDMRVVSLGTILGIDESLIPAINLNTGEGLWRETINSNWNKWD